MMATCRHQGFFYFSPALSRNGARSCIFHGDVSKGRVQKKHKQKIPCGGFRNIPGRPRDESHSNSNLWDAPCMNTPPSAHNLL